MLENKPFPICRILSERRARKERVTSADFWTIFRTSIQEFEFARNMQLSFSKISVYECLTKQKWSRTEFCIYHDWNENQKYWVIENNIYNIWEAILLILDWMETALQ